MNEHPHAAFLEAIRQSPDDDAPRLIFADWLEEEGARDRAEFIRVQCRLAAIDPDSDADHEADEWFVLKAREAQLLRRHGGEWSGDIGRTVKAWSFRRGFMEKVRVSTVKYFADPGAARRDSPIRDVCLTNVPFGIAIPDFVRRLLDHPQTSSLAALEFRLSGPDSLLRLAHAFSRAEPWPSFRELRLFGGFRGHEEAILKALTGGRILRQATSLTLAHNESENRPILTARGARLLEGGCPQLRSVALRGWEIAEDGGSALWASRGFEELRSLDLTHSDCRSNPLCSPNARNLRSLYATNLSLDPSCPFYSDSLTHCRLDQQQDERVIHAISELSPLRTLQLRYRGASADFVPPSFEVLLRNPLRTLILERALGSPSLFRTLADAPALASLKRFAIRGLGDQAHESGNDPRLADFLERASFAGLRELELEACGAGSRCVQVLAQAPTWRTLKTLRLSGNAIGDDAASALAESSMLGELAELDIRPGRIAKDVQARLRARFGPDVLYHRAPPVGRRCLDD